VFGVIFRCNSLG